MRYDLLFSSFSYELLFTGSSFSYDLLSSSFSNVDIRTETMVKEYNFIVIPKCQICMFSVLESAVFILGIL